MANKLKMLALDLDMTPMENGLRSVSGELRSLEKTLTGLQTKLAACFAAGALTGWLWQAVEQSGELGSSLTTLRSAFGQLTDAVGKALAPAARSVMELLSGAVTEATKLVNYFGEILQVFFGVDKGVQTVTKSQKKLTAATNASAKALQRSLMGFDQINRLQKKTGSTGSSGSSKETADQTQSGSAQKLPKLDFFQQGVLWGLRSIVQTAKSFDLGPIRRQLEFLRQAVEPHIPQLYAGLKFFWDEILLPFAKWTVEEAVPKFIKLLTVAVQSLSVVIYAAQPFLRWLWYDFLEPLGKWAGETLLGALDWLIQALADISNWVLDHRELTGWLVAIVGVLAINLLQCRNSLEGFTLLGTKSTSQMDLLGAALSLVKAATEGVSRAVTALSTVLLLVIGNWDKVAAGAKNALQGVKNAWQGVSGWFHEKVLAPLQNGFRNTANGIIGFVNGLLKGISSGINAVVRAINGLSITLPQWVPGLGGQTLGFHLKTVAAPQIPYLAQGAVLPANRPFLAMVGDQHHGTNVEAPLATIQDAVALVMEDMAQANLAGQEAIVERLDQLLSAVLGIRIGDEAIARAAQRYQRKLAVMKGGLL